MAWRSSEYVLSSQESRSPRADYSPIPGRKVLTLPGNARVAVWVLINVEHWDIARPMARTVLPAPQGREVTPDVANYGWHDYGLRVGFWRLKESLGRRSIRATLSLNAIVCEIYPQLVRESLESGWETLAHGYTQQVINVEPDEREVIRRTLTTIADFTGTTPRGWMGPGLAETFDTPDILAEEGIEYVCDWCNDDQPYLMNVKSGRLVSIPYTVELNDIAMYAVQNHRSSEIYDRVRDQFDVLYREGEESARVMAISTHPYITGVPHRMKYFDMALDYVRQFDGVLFMTGSEILDWYNSVA